MLATICDDTWNVLNMQIPKDGDYSDMMAIRRLMDPPT